jgi:hypothetical protein
MELYLHSPNTPSVRDAKLKHRDDFTLPYYETLDKIYELDGFSETTHAMTCSRNPLASGHFQHQKEIKGY